MHQLEVGQESPENDTVCDCPVGLLGGSRSPGLGVVSSVQLEPLKRSASGASLVSSSPLQYEPTAMHLRLTGHATAATSASCGGTCTSRRGARTRTSDHCVALAAGAATAARDAIASSAAIIAASRAQPQPHRYTRLS